MRLGSVLTVSCLAFAASAAPALAQATPCPHPGALGLARTVEVDTTGGPGFGFEQYKQYDFLVLKEAVLTFDDGPWPGNTRAVLDALAQECVKATFFPIGKHALWHPEILKEVAAAGHTVGGHTWSHANLSRGGGKGKGDKTADAKNEKAIEEIEKGFSAVKIALGAAPQPFFRFPYLQDPKEAVAYLGSRNIAVFSHDLDSFDFKIHKPEDVVKSVMTKLERKGKGIILMHDRRRRLCRLDIVFHARSRGRPGLGARCHVRSLSTRWVGRNSPDVIRVAPLGARTGAIRLPPIAPYAANRVRPWPVRPAAARGSGPLLQPDDQPEQQQRGHQRGVDQRLGRPGLHHHDEVDGRGRGRHVDQAMQPLPGARRRGAGSSARWR